VAERDLSNTAVAESDAETTFAEAIVDTIMTGRRMGIENMHPGLKMERKGDANGENTVRWNKYVEDVNQPFQDQLDLAIRRLVCLIKHPGFRSEQEARMLVFMPDDEHIHVRRSAYGLVEYVKLQAWSDMSGSVVPWNIDGIIVGSKNDNRYIDKAIEKLFKETKQSYNLKAVSRSNLPLR
jgi:hypothetical protein